MSPKKIKQPSLSDKLASLIDPTPAFDPEEDAEEGMFSSPKHFCVNILYILLEIYITM
jgi:hypothetical protein